MSTRNREDLRQSVVQLLLLPLSVIVQGDQWCPARKPGQVRAREAE